MTRSASVNVLESLVWERPRRTSKTTTNAMRPSAPAAPIAACQARSVEPRPPAVNAGPVRCARAMTLDDGSAGLEPLEPATGVDAGAGAELDAGAGSSVPIPAQKLGTR